MTVLDTFFFIFDADAKGVEEASKKGEQGARRLKGELDRADQSAQQLTASFTKGLRDAARDILGLLAIRAVANSIIRTTQEVDALGKSAAALSVGVDALDAWDSAVAKAGGSVGSFTASLEAFRKRMLDASITGSEQALRPFQRLGLGLEELKRGIKDPLSLLEQTADVFARLDASEAQALGEKLGLDQGTVTLLAQGRRGVEEAIKRQRELGTVTQEQAEITAVFNDQLDDTRRILGTLRISFFSSLLPYATEFLRLIERTVAWLRENKIAAVSFFGAIAAVVAAKYLPVIIAATKATFLLIAPWLLVGVAIAAVAAAFALAVDDVMAFLAGNESVIGKLAERWPIIGTIVRGIAAAIAKAWEVIGVVAQMALNPWESLVGSIRTAWALIKQFMGGVGAVIEKLSKPLALMLGVKAPEGLAMGQQQLATAAASNVGTMSAGAVTNANTRNTTRTNNVQIARVEVNTQATDGQGVADALARGLGDQITTAIDGFDDGVAA